MDKNGHLVWNNGNWTEYASDGIRQGLYGSTGYTGHLYNISQKKYRPKSDITITIYSQNAKRRAENSNGYLTQIEAMAVNLGHEIEHTTDEAIEMNAKGASIVDKEREPSRITQQLIDEYKMKKELIEIQSFYNMINDMALSY